MERDFKGVWIPKEIWLNTDLTMLDKVILVEIDSLDNEKHCIASNEYLSEFCQCSERKVSESIKKLCELGYIEIESFDGRVRTIKSRIRNRAPISMQSSKICESALQNLQANNIDSNIDSNTIRNYTPYNSNSAGSDNTDTGTTTGDEFESHAYSPSELKDSFLGSAGKQKRRRGKSLYEKCEDEIYMYTGNLVLQDELIKYLKFRLSMKDKPIYGLPQWQALLEKLGEVKGDKVKVVRQSIERGWASFFDFDVQKKSRGTNPDGKPRVDNQFGETPTMTNKRIDDLSDEERDDYNSGEGF